MKINIQDPKVLFFLTILQFIDDVDGNQLDDIINLAESARFVSAREYYCFKLQVRKKLFNIILFGGRLFQQWAVDMYIKIETMRLDWYSKPSNQKLLRADLYQVTAYYNGTITVSEPF